MAFREVVEALKRSMPKGADDRYIMMEALGRMLDGKLYDHLRFAYEDEEKAGGEYIPTILRRPSLDFNLAYEITHDTLSELFGDEQFPTVKVLADNGDQDEDVSKELQELIDELNVADVCAQAYLQGVIGSVGVVVHNDSGIPYFEVVPGKWCKPVYAGRYSNRLIGLFVTYPVEKSVVEKDWPELVKAKPDVTYWYRYYVGSQFITDFIPLSDTDYANIGKPDPISREIIAFKQYEEHEHGFTRAPALFVKNLGGGTQDIDGPCLWWPVRNSCVKIDYTLSQIDRALRYCADPLLFIRRGDLMDQMDVQMGEGKNLGGLGTVRGPGGAGVKSSSNTLVGTRNSEAKILEINAGGITEEREFIKDLREYALEVLGGQKARAQHLSASPSGKAMDKGLKPLRRLIRRQRRPYGNGLLLGLLEIVIGGYNTGVFDKDQVRCDVSGLSTESYKTLDWPKDETMQGLDLLNHVTAMQMIAGGSVKTPLELVKPAAVGEMLASDVGFHQPYKVIEGNAAEQAELSIDNARTANENFRNASQDGNPSQEKQDKSANNDGEGDD